MTTNGAPGPSVYFRYRFVSPPHGVWEFEINLDPDTLALMPGTGRADHPAWTQLTYHRCANCPLAATNHPHCPVAVHLVPVIDGFADAPSYLPAEIEIATRHRTYRKQAPLQDGLSAMVGIYMVTSGCPILDKLRPLVATHVPFASHQETTFRAISMYWLVQFFRRQRGEEPDWDLDGLVKIYEDISIVNRCFHERIRDAHPADACVNALFRLDLYAQFTNRMLLQKNLDSVARLFRGYMRE